MEADVWPHAVCLPPVRQFPRRWQLAAGRRAVLFANRLPRVTRACFGEFEHPRIINWD